jgi:hypothetical protein
MNSICQPLPSHQRPLLPLYVQPIAAQLSILCTKFHIMLPAFLLRNGYLQGPPQTVAPLLPRRAPQEPSESRAHSQCTGYDHESPDAGAVSDLFHVHPEYRRSRVDWNEDERQDGDYRGSIVSKVSQTWPRSGARHSREIALLLSSSAFLETLRLRSSCCLLISSLISPVTGLASPSRRFR